MVWIEEIVEDYDGDGCCFGVCESPGVCSGLVVACVESAFWVLQSKESF